VDTVCASLLWTRQQHSNIQKSSNIENIKLGDALRLAKSVSYAYDLFNFLNSIRVVEDILAVNLRSREVFFFRTPLTPPYKDKFTP
jgi:hypothetical protein